MQDIMELSWCEKDIALPLFLKRYRLPQIVQIVEGTYGEDDETTLSQGQVLNLHLVKDMHFYSGFKDSGQEVHIPLNCPHRVSVFLNRKGIQYNNLEELCDLFPKKYRYIHLENSRRNPCDPKKTIDADDILETIYFDKDTKSLICLDHEGCEVSIGLDMLHEVRPIEQIDGVFMVEVYQRYSLPLRVQFISQKSSLAKLERGPMIHLKRVIVKETVVASTRDTDYKSILTFPSSLDVTVLVPQGATADTKLYRHLRKHLNSEINFKKVEETIENEVYEDVRVLAIKAIPYAETFFGKSKNKGIKPIQKEKKVKLTQGMDGYISIDDSSDDSSNKSIYEVMDSPPLSPLMGPPLSPSIVTYERPLPAKPSTPHNCSNPVTSPTSSTNRWSGFFRRTLSTLGRKKQDSSSGLVSPTTSPTGSLSSPDSLKSSSFMSYKSKENDDDNDDGEEYEYPYLRPAIPQPRDVGRHYDEPQQTVIKANRKIEDLTIKEVGMLLHDLNLGQYGEIFEREQIDGRMLKDLDKEMLQSHFNMTHFHAHKLMKASKENWRPTAKE